MDIEDTEACYRAVKARDRRFDGVFYTAVRTTGIYCRPSCPALTPHKKNVAFYRTAAAAQGAGFRACRRCLPDATPGSPEWDVAADVTGRAMRLIADGVVDREGVEGLAHRVGYTSRHLSRLLTTELGAGPLALARARRAQTARILIETTSMSFADAAFASGFASVRQFNDTVRVVYASSPTELRGRRATTVVSPGQIDLRLAVRQPFAARELLAFLARRVVPGIEAAGPGWYERSLRLPHGQGTVRLSLPSTEAGTGTGFVDCTLRLCDLRDVAAAVERCRRMLDADCDPVAVDDELSGDPRLAGLVRRRPGLRVPGHVDGHEIAVRAVLGQQISVARAGAIAGQLVERYGEPLPTSGADEQGDQPSEITHLFPSAAVLAEVPPEDIPMPRARGRALNALCTALAAGDIALDRSAERSDVRTALLAVPGIGPWTADYIAMRALGDPDVFLPTDVGVRQGVALLGEDPRQAEELSQAWRPWRSYAQMHLWSSLSSAPDQTRQPEEK
jgi:AraC family transcriptional regulator, regulatory protein of adaptative response / DNA-3-methyladenine glycosylase II